MAGDNASGRLKPRRVWRWRLRRWLHERWVALRAPWPIVPECHSWHRPGHSCPQCDGSHEHRWAAWTIPTADNYRLAFTRGQAVRCRRCGARKCDVDGCVLMRHHRTPHLEASRR